VLEAAAAMGYRPNPTGTALAHLRQTSTVVPVQASLAWINGWSDPAKLRSYREFELYWQGAAEEAADHGYRLDEFVVGPDLPLPKLERILQARNVRGLLLPPGPMPAGWEEFDWGGFSIVRLSHLPDPGEFAPCAVVGDQTSNALVAVRNILGKGYQRIGFAGNSDSRRGFAAGFLWGQQETSEDLRVPPLIMASDDPVEWEEHFREWFLMHRPDAILTDIPEVPAALSRLDVKVPEDVGIAALGILDCPITAGIDQNSREIGRSAVQMLHSLIKDGALGLPRIHRELLVKGTWVDGASMPEARKSRKGSPRKTGSEEFIPLGR
jgi:DNA-binding LacI/PurR family transcriptional regulator